MVLDLDISLSEEEEEDEEESLDFRFDFLREDFFLWDFLLARSDRTDLWLLSLSLSLSLSFSLSLSLSHSERLLSSLRFSRLAELRLVAVRLLRAN